MIRLRENGNNSPEEYDRIFSERQKRKTDKQDIKRWKLMIKPYKSGRVLDIGTLDSMIPVLCKRRSPNSEMYAIDLAENAINAMKRLYPYVNYSVMDAYKMSFPDAYFDAIFIGEVLEHLERPQEALNEALRVLKPNGLLVTSTPYNEAIEVGAVDADRHVFSFDQEDMKELLGRDGLLNFIVLGSQYFPYKYKFPTLITYFRKYGGSVHTS